MLLKMTATTAYIYLTRLSQVYKDHQFFTFSYDIDIEFETVQSIEITSVEMVQSSVEILEN